jgi:3-phytase
LRITPTKETEPVGSSGDAADDPAILVADQDHTWIVGTDKKWGLIAYDLDGQPQASIARGRLNNVDAVPTADGFLLAATNRTTHSIDLFKAEPRQSKFDYLRSIPVSLDDPYGLCMGQHGNRVLIFAGGKDGEVQMWELPAEAEPNLAETLRFDSQTEGCVYDPGQHQLFVGEEERGVWQIDLTTGQRHLFAATEDGVLVADVEGMDLCELNQERVLVVSSQGDDSFVILTLDVPHGGGTKFKIVANEKLGIDGASETDGLACNNAAINGYPQGILVVQDGRNRAPDANQNFKIVDWRAIHTAVQGRIAE